MVGLKDKIAAGKKVTGTMLRIVRNPAIAYLADQAGMDFLMFDCEHSNYSLETIHDIALTANALGVAVMARIPHLREEYVAQMLEAGLEGIQEQMSPPEASNVNLFTAAKYEVSHLQTLPLSRTTASRNTAASEFLARHLPAPLLNYFCKD